MQPDTNNATSTARTWEVQAPNIDTDFAKAAAAAMVDDGVIDKKEMRELFDVWVGLGGGIFTDAHGQLDPEQLRSHAESQGGKFLADLFEGADDVVSYQGVVFFPVVGLLSTPSGVEGNDARRAMAGLIDLARDIINRVGDDEFTPGIIDAFADAYERATGIELPPQVTEEVARKIAEAAIALGIPVSFKMLKVADFFNEVAKVADDGIITKPEMEDLQAAWMEVNGKKPTPDRIFKVIDKFGEFFGIPDNLYQPKTDQI